MHADFQEQEKTRTEFLNCFFFRHFSPRTLGFLPLDELRFGCRYICCGIDCHFVVVFLVHHWIGLHDGHDQFVCCCFHSCWFRWQFRRLFCWFPRLRMTIVRWGTVPVDMIASWDRRRNRCSFRGRCSRCDAGIGQKRLIGFIDQCVTIKLIDKFVNTVVSRLIGNRRRWPRVSRRGVLCGIVFVIRSSTDYLQREDYRWWPDRRYWSLPRHFSCAASWLVSILPRNSKATEWEEQRFVVDGEDDDSYTAVQKWRWHTGWILFRSGTTSYDGSILFIASDQFRWTYRTGLWATRWKMIHYHSVAPATTDGHFLFHSIHRLIHRRCHRAGMCLGCACVSLDCLRNGSFRTRCARAEKYLRCSRMVCWITFIAQVMTRALSSGLEWLKSCKRILSVRRRLEELCHSRKEILHLIFPFRRQPVKGVRRRIVGNVDILRHADRCRYDRCLWLVLFGQKIAEQAETHVDTRRRSKRKRLKIVQPKWHSLQTRLFAEHLTRTVTTSETMNLIVIATEKLGEWWWFFFSSPSARLMTHRRRRRENLAWIIITA